MMLAQRYPTLYDGISAGAPAFYWNELLAAIQWPEQFMSFIDSYPYSCELDAINAAAVSACDGLDGIVDGVITDVDICLATFDPYKLVGTTINCTQAGKTIPISETAAAVINATWGGPYTADGKQIWYGYNPGADITGNSQPAGQQMGIAATNCTTGDCVGVPYFLSDPWVRFFLAKDPAFDPFNITHTQFDSLVHRGQQEYQSSLETSDPNLSEFRNAGGKLLSFHGLVSRVHPHIEPDVIIDCSMLIASCRDRPTKSSLPKAPKSITNKLPQLFRKLMTFSGILRFRDLPTATADEAANQISFSRSYAPGLRMELPLRRHLSKSPI